MNHILEMPIFIHGIKPLAGKLRCRCLHHRNRWDKSHCIWLISVEKNMNCYIIRTKHLVLWKEITLSIVLEIVELKITFCCVWWLQMLHLFPLFNSIIFKVRQVLRFCLKKPKEEEGCLSYSCSIKLKVPWACSLPVVT